MSRPRTRHVLVTGLPHFVGSLTTRAILRDEPQTRVTVLARADRIDRVGQLLGTDSRAELVPARIVRADLGLDDEARMALFESVTDIYHFESLYHLGVDRRQAEDVNIQATRNLLEFARRATHLARFNHYSTAFVSGDRQGIVLESELDRGQRFRNTYERTRFTAELEVRRAAGELPVTIFRPSLVVGSSVDGSIDVLDGPYFLLQLLTHTPGRVPLRVPSGTDAPFNVVPADFVAEAIHALARNPEAVGVTYHLVDPAPVRVADALQLVAEYANHGVSPPRMHGWIRDRLLRVRPIEKRIRAGRAYLHELDGATWFNAGNALRDLRETGILCPAFPDYVERLVANARTAERGAVPADLISRTSEPPLPREH